jgi:hypothetical protein
MSIRTLAAKDEKHTHGKGCPRCDYLDALAADVEPIIEALRAFLDFKPQDRPDWPRRAAYGKEGYEKGDEDAPFYTEAYLYNLLGKEDARTLLMYERKARAALARWDAKPVEPESPTTGARW